MLRNVEVVSLNKEMKSIQKWQDLNEFAGKIIMFDTSKVYLIGSGGYRFKESNLRMAKLESSSCVVNNFPGLSGPQQGFSAQLLHNKDDVQGLSNFFDASLEKANLKVRLPTPEEFSEAETATQNNAYFSFDNAKESLLTVKSVVAFHQTKDPSIEAAVREGCEFKEIQSLTYCEIQTLRSLRQSGFTLFHLSELKKPRAFSVSREVALEYLVLKKKYSINDAITEIKDLSDVELDGIKLGLERTDVTGLTSGTQIIAMRELKSYGLTTSELKKLPNLSFPQRDALAFLMIDCKMPADKAVITVETTKLSEIFEKNISQKNKIPSRILETHFGKSIAFNDPIKRIAELFFDNLTFSNSTVFRCFCDLVLLGYNLKEFLFEIDTPSHGNVWNQICNVRGICGMREIKDFLKSALKFDLEEFCDTRDFTFRL